MKINHTMYISKILTDLCAIKQKLIIKGTFTSIVYNVLVVKKSYKSIKKIALTLNGKQTVKLKHSSIEFKNYFKQSAVSF